MKNILAKGLKKIEGSGSIQSFQRVPGGSINEAFYVRTDKNEYFVKVNKDVNLSFFQLEQEGLELIRKTNTIAVPKVYDVFSIEEKDTTIPMLWIEWVNGRKHENTEKLLGERLAAMHLCEGAEYGYERDSYIGRLKQENQLITSWLIYYREQRLGGQLKLGRKIGTISGKREERLNQLLESLHQWIPDKPKCSLLHGDLWGGNWITGREGEPYLIDPSILYGDHEFEIAFTELFGGFSQPFYEAYQATFPLSDDYHERKELYQLYYLLVHLNMFGETYGGAVDRILQKYTS